jgi:hypothetical protein
MSRKVFELKRFLCTAEVMRYGMTCMEKCRMTGLRSRTAIQLIPFIKKQDRSRVY